MVRLRHSTDRRTFRSRRAQSLVEFALVVPLFFLLVFAILDLGRLYFVQSTLQHAMRQAGRFAITGQKLPGFTTRVDSIIEVAKRAAVGLDIKDIQMSSVFRNERFAASNKCERSRSCTSLS